LLLQQTGTAAYSAFFISKEIHREAERNRRCRHGRARRCGRRRLGAIERRRQRRQRRFLELGRERRFVRIEHGLGIERRLVGIDHGIGIERLVGIDHGIGTGQRLVGIDHGTGIGQHEQQRAGSEQRRLGFGRQQLRQRLLQQPVRRPDRKRA
jgi:hypothetical protein